MMGAFIQQIFTELTCIPAPALSPKRQDADPSLSKLTVNDSENHNAMC